MFAVSIDTFSDRRAWHKRFYQMFDYTFEVRADSWPLIEQLDVFLNRFSVQEEKGGDIYYLIAEPSVFGSPAICIERKGYPVSDAQYLPGYALLLVMRNVSMRVTSHFLFHAGALHYRGKGFVFTASPGGGKSTLMLELLRRGFQFLSDDTTAVGVSDYRLYPFPLPLKMDESGMSLFQEAVASRFIATPLVDGEEREYIMQGLSNVEHGSFHFDSLICLYPEKDFHAFSSGCEKNQCPEIDQEKEKGSTHAIIDILNEEMIRELRKDSRVEDIQVSPRCNFYNITIIWRGKRFTSSELEDVCSRHDVFLMAVSYGRSEMADYQSFPVLEKISKAQAALELLKSYRGGLQSLPLHKETQTSPALFLMKLGDLSRGVKGFVLSPGRLSEMADRVCDLI